MNCETKQTKQGAQRITLLYTLQRLNAIQEYSQKSAKKGMDLQDPLV